MEKSGVHRGITPVSELPTYRPRDRWGEPSELEKRYAAEHRRQAEEHSRQLFADRAQRRRDFELATLQRELAKLRKQLSPDASQRPADRRERFFPARTYVRYRIEADTLRKAGNAGDITWERRGKKLRYYLWDDVYARWPSLLPTNPPTPS